MNPWTKTPVLIGLAGKARSGKNMVADFLSEKYEYKQLSFAKKVKDYAERYFDIDPSTKNELSRRV